MNEKDLQQARGHVVGSFASIESDIDWIVGAVLFKGNVPEWFNQDLVSNEHYSFGLRVSLFERTVTSFEGREFLDKKPRKDLIETIRQLGTIRNIFAHVGHTYAWSEDEKLYRHPRKQSYDLDLDAYLAEFNSKLEQVRKVVDALAREVSDLYEN